MSAAPSPRERIQSAYLQLLATGSVAAPRPLPDLVASALRAGVDVVQVREKEAPDGRVLDLCARLLPLCRAAGALLIVNDRAHLVGPAGADGVHLGQQDAPVAEARALLPDGALVGLSTHDDGELDAALAAGADYVGVGSVFPTTTKGTAVTVGSPGALVALALRAELAGVPAFAIGGITPANVADVHKAGFRRIAVCAAVLRAADPAAAVAALRA